MKLKNQSNCQGLYCLNRNRQFYDGFLYFESIFRKRSLSPVETKKKKKKHRSLTEFINEDTTKTVNDTEQLALYLLSK